MQGRFKKSIMKWWFRKESKSKGDLPGSADNKKQAEMKREMRRKKRLALR